MNTNKRKGIPAVAFMAAFSSAGQHEQKRQQAELFAPPQFTVVERWDGHKFIEVRLEWDGTAYKEIQ
jgi:hypothetical protein